MKFRPKNNPCKGRDVNNSCDEYPFASSFESGGLTDNNDPAVLRCVPVKHNQGR